MRINEKYQKTEKCEKMDFDSCSKYFFDETPNEIYQKIRTCEK